MAKRVLKQADLEANPQLQLDGYKAGDTYDDGVEETQTEDTSEADQENEETTENGNEAATDDTGGGAPPPDKPRDDN